MYVEVSTKLFWLRWGIALVSSLLAVIMATAPVRASDLVRLNASASNEGAGSIAGFDPTPQTALMANPALLESIDDGTVLTLSGLAVNSSFTSRLGETARADRGPGLLPQVGIKGTIADSGWSWGAGLVVQSALRADFLFTDPPGTGGVSYGLQRHRSQWIIAKVAGALSYQFSNRLTVGVGLGLAYNRNELQAPYIFQSHPVLAGLKVLVDLSADDVAPTSTIGLRYILTESLDFNLAYSMQTDFSADGVLAGNLSQLGLGIEQDFHYAANVETALPAVLLAGLSWQANERLKLGLQLDRIFWQDSFESLPIRLIQGSNTELNDFLGASSIADTAPLQWRNQDSFHIGGEYRLNSGNRIRFGYEETEAIVPGRTFTPMTGAILDRAYTAGLQFKFRQRRIDVAYRFSTARELQVVDSALLGGEYEGTRQSLDLHSVFVSFAL